jgi:hypothetical protein
VWFILCRLDDFEVWWRKLTCIVACVCLYPSICLGDSPEIYDKTAASGSGTECGTSRIETKYLIARPRFTFYSLINIWVICWLSCFLLRRHVFWNTSCTVVHDDCLRWKKYFPNAILSLDLCCFLALENEQEKDKEMRVKTYDCGIYWENTRTSFLPIRTVRFSSTPRMQRWLQ